MRTYPLFIIDTDRSHGRGRETDFLCCTSASCPFIAEVTIITDAEYREYYNPSDYKVIYSDNVRGLRKRIKIIDLRAEHTEKEVKNLLARAMKEVLKRSAAVAVDTANVSDEAVKATIEVLNSQVTENLRENPSDTQQKMLRAVFAKILSVFNS